jgi:hypothetical protein
MAAKKKLPTQPKRLQQAKKTPDIVEANPVIEDVVIEQPKKEEEVYVPSLNADKYPTPEVPKIQYKILAFKNDYVRLQDEVMKHLNEGWQLSGGISTSMTVSPYESVTVFAQAIVKH